MKTLCISILMLFINLNFFAQCENGRYRDQIFPLISVTSDIAYGQNENFNGQVEMLKLDVYQPLEDTENLRPLVIFAHGGYFLGGDKADDTVVPLCDGLAKMGYVTSSIGYRLGIPLQFPLDAPFMEAIVRAVHDMRAAIRFFRKSAAEDGNPYGINPNEIYVGGVSAGGFVALHLAYLDEDEIPPIINFSNPGLGGGYEGESGNEGYSSEIKGIVSIAGAIGDTLWIGNGDVPAFLEHGSEDTVVPFGSAMLTMMGMFEVAEVDGSSSIHQRMDNLEIDNCFKILWGQDHLPNHDIELYADTTISLVSNFLSHYVCPSTPIDCEYRELVVEAKEEVLPTFILYPNPASGMVYLSDSRAGIKGVYDALFRKIQVESGVRQIDTSRLDAGIYFVVIERGKEQTTERLIVN